MHRTSIFWWLLYLIWGGMVLVMFTGVLDSRESELVTPEDLLDEVNLDAESTWMGIYVQGSRIGYVHSELKPRSGGGYEIREFSHIEGAMMGTQQVMRIRMDVIADSALALVEFDGRLDAAPYSTTFKGRVEDKVLSVHIGTAGKVTERFFPAPEPLYLSQVIKPLLQSGKLSEGDSLKLSGFDPVSMEMQDIIVLCGGQENRMFKGQEVDVRKLTTRLAGFESTIYVDKDGNTLEEHGPMGIVMRREQMQQALDIENGGGGVDFLAVYSVKPLGFMAAPRKTSRARYKISKFNAVNLGDVSDRQRVVDHDSNIIEVTTESEPGHITEREFEEYTADAPLIESRNPRIGQAAAEAMNDGMNRLDSLNRLSEWVFKAVDKKHSAGLPSALAVLETRQGDCNEHSMLFTALARSVGIPARLQLGLVYQAGRFYYHAWPAAWVDDRWIEFEPTFGLKTVDAARITLASGNLGDSIELAGAIGKIEVEILEVGE